MLRTTTSRKRRIAGATIEKLEDRRLLSAVVATIPGNNGGVATNDGTVLLGQSEPYSDTMTKTWYMTLGSLPQHTHMDASFGIAIQRTNLSDTNPDTFSFMVDGRTVYSVTSTPTPDGVWETFTRDSEVSYGVQHTSDNAIVIVSPSIEPGDYYTITHATVTARAMYWASPIQDSTRDLGAQPLIWRISRDGAPNHVATFFYSIYGGGASVTVTNAQDDWGFYMGDLYGEQDIPGKPGNPIPPAGTFMATIPAGSDHVDVALYPTGNAWIDMNGVDMGDADTPATLTPFKPDSIGFHDDLWAYDDPQTGFNPNPTGANDRQLTTTKNINWQVEDNTRFKGPPGTPPHFVPASAVILSAAGITSPSARAVKVKFKAPAAKSAPFVAVTFDPGVATVAPASGSTNTAGVVNVTITAAAFVGANDTTQLKVSAAGLSDTLGVQVGP